MPPATAGWQQWAGKPQVQIPFSELSPDSVFFLCLPTFDERTTELHLQAEKFTETVLHLNLGHLVGFFFVRVGVVLFYFMCPLWWDNYRATSEAPSPGLETETDTQIMKTENSLHLNLEIFWFFGFLKFSIFSFYFNTFLYIDFTFIYLFFIFIIIFFFIFDFQSSLCLSNVCSAYCVISTLELPVYTFEIFLSDTLFCFLPPVCVFVFPISLTSCFPSQLTLPF
jgi:hypothetical protein